MVALEERRGAGHLVRVLETTGAVPTVPQLEAFLARAQASHPLLCVELGVEEGEPIFRTMSPSRVPIRSVVRESDTSWVEVCEDELNNSKWPRHGPLVRVVIVAPDASEGEAEVILVFHHATADGQAASLLCRELLASYGDPLGENVAATPDLPPPVEHALAPTILEQGRSRVAAFVAEQMEQHERPVPCVWGTTLSADTALSRIVHRRFPAGVIEAVRSLARQRGTSVHAALSAALLKAGQDLLHGEPTELPIVSSVSLRTLLRPEQRHDAVAQYSSGVRNYHSLERDTDIWIVAGAAGRSMNSALEQSDHVATLLLQEHAIDHYIDRREDAFVWLSNVGVLAPVPRGRLRLRGVHGCIPAHGLGSMVHVHVSTAATRSVWNFTYPEPLVVRDRVELFADSALNHVLAMVRG